MEWYEIIISIFSGLTVTIPLVIKIVEYVKKAIKEKNWKSVLTLVMNLMSEAEVLFNNGADRRAWVLNMIEASADSINYDIDLNQVGELIDNLCSMSKVVNAPKTEIEE